MGAEKHAAALQRSWVYQYHRPFGRARGLPGLPDPSRCRRIDRTQQRHLPDQSARNVPPTYDERFEHIPFVTGWGDKWFRVGSLKTMIDGGILIGTAYLREPYGSHTQIYGFVEPGYRGVFTYRERMSLRWHRSPTNWAGK